jgi:hypothetical protein
VLEEETRFLEKGCIERCGRGDQGSSNEPDGVSKPILRGDKKSPALL